MKIKLAEDREKNEAVLRPNYGLSARLIQVEEAYEFATSPGSKTPALP
jgi:hypothetical protein